MGESREFCRDGETSLEALRRIIRGRQALAQALAYRENPSAEPLERRFSNQEFAWEPRRCGVLEHLVIDLQMFLGEIPRVRFPL